MPQNFDNYREVEVKDCVFIKGLRTNSNIKVSDVRDYFQKSIGECSVQKTSLSKDKDHFFIALKFKTTAIAENVIERYNGAYVFGNRVFVSYWRAPRSSLHSFEHDLSPVRSNSRSPRWERCNHSTDNAGYYRDKNSQIFMMSNPREDWCDEDKISLHDCENHTLLEGDEIGKFNFDEESRHYLQENWEGDNPVEGYYEHYWDDSDYSGGSAKLSEIEYHDGNKEAWFQPDDDTWKESRVDINEPYVDELDQRDYDTGYLESDMNREFFTDLYQDRSKDEGYDVYPEETIHRTKKTIARKRESRNEREYNNAQCSQNSLGDFSEKNSAFEQTAKWSRRESLSCRRPPRGLLSDAEILHGMCNQFSNEKDLAEQRFGWKKSRGLTSGKTGTSSDERLRKDMWLRAPKKDEGQGHYGASEKNWELSPPLARNQYGSAAIRHNDTFLDRTHNDRDSGGYRRSNSPVGNRRFWAYGRRRSSSSELSSDYSRYDSSPQKDSSRHSCNEQRSSPVRQSVSHNYPRSRRDSPTVRHGGIQGRRSERSLRRSLLNQQRILSSQPRGVGSEKEARHISFGSRKKTCSSDLVESRRPQRSTESRSPAKGNVRKRQRDEEEKNEEDVKMAKKRKQTNYRSQSEIKKKRNEDIRKVVVNTTRKVKQQSRGKRKRETPKTDSTSKKLNTKRTDRLLSDVAASLAEDNILLSRPDLNVCTPQEGALDGISSVGEGSSNSTGSPVASSKDTVMSDLKQDRPQETCLCKIDPCIAVDNDHSKPEVASKSEIISVNLNTTAEIDVSFIKDNSVQGFDVSKEFQSNLESLPKDCLFPTNDVSVAKQNSDFDEDRLVIVDPSSKDHNCNSAFEKNGSFAGISEASKDGRKMAVVTQVEKPSWRSESCHVIDMEFSCGDTSPHVVHEEEIVCFCSQSNNTGNFSGKKCGTNKPSSDFARFYRKEDIILDESGSELHKAESSGCVVNTCKETTEGKYENGSKRVLDTGKKMLSVRTITKGENERQLSCNAEENNEGSLAGLPSKSDYDCVTQQITERRNCAGNSEFNMNSTEDNDLRMESHSAVVGNGIEEEIPKTISAGGASKEPHSMGDAEYTSQKGGSLQSLKSCKKGDYIKVRSESCGSSAVDTRITLVSQTDPVNYCSTGKSDNEDQEIDYLQRATDLSHIDMEISDEEHRGNVSNLTDSFPAEDNGGRYGISTPYSSISSMRNSNGPCSPCHPKDDSSPYSPSHPTNVSGGDGEGNVPVKQLCYDGEQRDDGDTSETSENITPTTNEVTIDSKTVIKQVTDGKDVDTEKNRSSSIAKSPHLHPSSSTKNSAQHGVTGNNNCLEGEVGKGTSYVDKNTIDINDRCGPDQIHVTGKKALSPGLFNTGYLNEHKQFPWMPNDGNICNPVACSNNEFQQATENTLDVINQSAKIAPILPSAPTEKRPQVGDSSIGVSRPSKTAQRKLPKLIIPTKKITERCGKGRTYSGVTTAPKANCSTKASGELNPATESYNLLSKVSENGNGAVKDALDVGMGTGNVNENEMKTLSSPSQEKRDVLQGISSCLPTCTVTGTNSETQHASEDSSHQEGDVTVKGKFKRIKTDGLNNKLSTSNCSSFSEGVQFYQGNLSSLTTTSNTTHLVSPSFLSVENSGMENQKGKEFSTDDRANHQGNKSDWIAFKMERLRRKKKQIEQEYRRDCYTVVTVVKMLVSKDPRLEGVLQNAVRQSLQDMGQRCVQQLEKECLPATRL